ncbi:MAG: hypothetical protein SGI89_03095 [bacterium]|nr:hypothetical protein [bacterium]
MSDFKNLFLLIGTNPLPNYVVAKYFIDTNKFLENICFIYSSANTTFHQSSTIHYAENIAKVLKKNGLNEKINIHYIPVENIENKQSITNAINTFLSKNVPSGIIHLNYTGGTKQMGIHSNEFFAGEVFKKHYSVEIETSYLSARNFKLIGGDDNVICDNLNENVNMIFEDLIELHGFKRINEDKTSHYSGALKVFEDFISSDILDKYYKDYSRLYFEDDNGQLITTFKKANAQFTDMVIQGKLLEVSNAFQEDFKIFDSEGKFKSDLVGTTNEKDSKVKYAIKFFDGDWLEEYVYKILNEDNEVSKMSPLANWVIKKPTWTDKLNFELDILLMNGYQLYGISCTTSDKIGMCKSKGFEILLRTKQIGGDEAKSVLISRLTEENVDKLQLELETDTGGTGNILILGKKDLKKDVLIKKIKKFLKGD